MEYYYIPNAPISEDQGEGLVQDGVVKRKRMAGDAMNPDAAAAMKVAAATGGAVTAQEVQKSVQRSLVDALMGEFQDIRDDPERRSRQMDELIRTYDNFVQKTGNPVEYFVNQPGSNQWAAGRLKTGEDVVFWDSSAPHAAVMAHELGHVDMNHSVDPLALLQRSGIGRMSGNLAPGLGAAGALAGQLIARKRNNTLGSQMKGAALGTIGGAALGSGNFLYELPGASGRALDYLPEDVDQMDAAGDLTRAGMTYFMGGPGAALATGTGVALAGGALRDPRLQQRISQMMSGTMKNAN